jgi:acyl-CoA dehydrogenase
MRPVATGFLLDSLRLVSLVGWAARCERPLAKDCQFRKHALPLMFMSSPSTFSSRTPRGFFQEPPVLPDPWATDASLQSYLERTLNPEHLALATTKLQRMADISRGALYTQWLKEPTAEPHHIAWDAWGHRVDKIELTKLWELAKVVAAEEGVVATAYERAQGPSSRVMQMALAYLFMPSTGYFGCPLAMTDGAASVLERFLKNPEAATSPFAAAAKKAFAHLTSREGTSMWTSGQWMTERTGGSDVAISETIAETSTTTDEIRAEKEGSHASHRLFGTKWFTSAATSEVALTLARPRENPPGGPGLALYMVLTRGSDNAGLAKGIRINRLKDKLGTKMLPTAELTLEGVEGMPLFGSSNGIRNIAPMLNVTRTWNAIAAVSGMRRAISLAESYARVRIAFGSPLAQKPLHLDTLARLEGIQMGAFHLAFRVVELLGKEECGVATEEEQALMRILTPIAKLTTAKQAVEVASEAIEAFGGAGYIEDTGLPPLLRDAQVLPIWEGTTNVLSLDVLRTIGRDPKQSKPLSALRDEVRQCLEEARDLPRAEAIVNHVQIALDRVCRTLTETEPTELEGKARKLALSLGRIVETALLLRQASFERAKGKAARALVGARVLAQAGLCLLDEEMLALSVEDCRLLTNLG